MRVAFITEEGFYARRFIEKRQPPRCLKNVRQVIAIIGRLVGDSRKGSAFRLGFDNADGLSIDEQEIVARPTLERHFAQRNAATSGGGERFVILNSPAALFEGIVDLLACLLFRGHVCER